MIRRSYLTTALFALILSPLLTRAQAPLFCDTSAFNQPIPADARYIPEPRIGTFRQNQSEWSAPIVRLAESTHTNPITIINDTSGRTVIWPIPIDALPASAGDHHLIVMGDRWLYELWNARWQDDTLIHAGGMFRFPIHGTGISNPRDQRVTAAGFAVSAGMVIREDFMDAQTGQLNPTQTLQHALTMSLHVDIVNNGYVAPAVGGEVAGRGDSITGIPMGAHFALASMLPDTALTNLHPLTRVLLIASRDYGIFINDTNSAPPFQGKYVGNLRIEPDLLALLYGVDNDALIAQVQSEVAQIISQYGIYRVEYPILPVACLAVPTNP